jgi:hypothetical protein
MLNEQRFPLLGLYLKFGLYRILIYSGIGLDKPCGQYHGEISIGTVYFYFIWIVKILGRKEKKQTTSCQFVILWFEMSMNNWPGKMNKDFLYWDFI